MVQYIFSAGEQVERVIDDVSVKRHYGQVPQCAARRKALLCKLDCSFARFAEENLRVKPVVQVWYLAKVISYDPKGRVYSIEYLDDGKTEHNVMCDEVRGLVKRLEKSAVEAHPLELGIDEQPEQEREVDRRLILYTLGPTHNLKLHCELLQQAQNGKTGKLGPEWQTPLADEKLHKIREVLTTKTHPVIDDTSSEGNQTSACNSASRTKRKRTKKTQRTHLNVYQRDTGFLDRRMHGRDVAIHSTLCRALAMVIEGLISIHGQVFVNNVKR